VTALGPLRLDGQVALVTGVTRGIGAAVALALADAGADILGLYHGEAGTVGSVGEQVHKRGRDFVGIRVDLETLGPDGGARAVDEALAAEGRIDVLVNNAGTIIREPALDVSEAHWRTVLDINLTAGFLLTQATARYFLSRMDVSEGSRRGTVINVASVLSYSGGVNVVAYTASKSAVAGMTRALANEWARHSVNVNAIAPGYIATRATEELRSDPSRAQQVLDRIPAGRWGQPSDIGGAAVFLASRAPDYVHGAVIPVDGGWLAR
jgi:2-deoxy-D-gluconate 3-dehydrogenase